MWIIENDVLTNTEFISVPEKIMTEPYPLALWRIESGVNGGFPFTGLMIPAPGKIMTEPYPLALWRIESGVNSGFPFTGLMTGIDRTAESENFTAAIKGNTIFTGMSGKLVL